MKEKVYAAETAAYQEKLASDAEKDPDEDFFDTENIDVKVMSEGDEMVSEDIVAEGTGEDLKEVPIPGMDENAPKRKVVTTDDAPDFDPSGL